ncbi:hypothetical protein [Singulisphaera sp. PoT]|uniref:hypothetical protein n=1 Tax=Singulisphaera sp. PoT TaxID=3411797 RepID=UPI003BF5547D
MSSRIGEGSSSGSGSEHVVRIAGVEYPFAPPDDEATWGPLNRSVTNKLTPYLRIQELLADCNETTRHVIVKAEFKKLVEEPESYSIDSPAWNRLMESPEYVMALLWTGMKAADPAYTREAFEELMDTISIEEFRAIQFGKAGSE